MRRSAGLLALLLLVLPLTGCLSESGETSTTALDPPALVVPDRWWAGVLANGGGHDHGDVALHAGLTTPNFEVVGYDPLVTDGLGTTAAGMGCGGAATRADGQRLAVAHSFTSDVAFVVADVTDPSHPVKLGEYLMPNVRVWDATITADGLHVLVAADPPIPPRAQLPPVVPNGVIVQPLWRDGCTGEVRAAGEERYVPYGPSVVLVGIHDPTAPVVEDIVAQPVLGPHSVSSQLIDGTVYAISSVTNLVHEASYYSFFEVVETPLGGRLVPLTVIEAPGHPEPGRFNGHVDAELHIHPVTGQLLAYLANWDEGVVIYDMTEPRAPAMLGQWKDELGAIHGALPLDDVRGGRHYTIAGQEVAEGDQEEPALVYVLDTTDPASPVEVARWTFPTKPVGWEWDLQFSAHYVDVVGDTLFVAAYHGGVWAVDIRDPSAPTAVGVLVPDRASPAPPEGGAEVSVEDVIADADGTLTIWDGGGGIYQVRFQPEIQAPGAPLWQAE